MSPWMPWRGSRNYPVVVVLVIVAMAPGRRWLSEAAKSEVASLPCWWQGGMQRDLSKPRMVCREDTAIVEGNAVTFSGSRLAIAGPEEDCEDVLRMAFFFIIR